MFDGSTALSTLTPRTIARGVKKPSRLQAAEAELIEAKVQREALKAEVRRLTNLPRSAHLEVDHTTITRAAAAEEACLVRIGRLRSEVVALAAQHGEKVRQALEPSIANAAGR